MIEGHHTHYYCRYCKFNFNPFGWWKKPTEQDECTCTNNNNNDPDNSSTSSWSDPDEEFYEEPWNPRYESEAESWEDNYVDYEPVQTILIDEEQPEHGPIILPIRVEDYLEPQPYQHQHIGNPWDGQPLVDYPWWETPLREEIWWTEPKLVRADDRMDHLNVVANLEPKFVLSILYDDQGVYLSQRINPTKPMYLNYQAPCGKVEGGETSIQAAHRETYEETNLSIPQKRFKFLVNDPEFDCDLYICKLKGEEIPERTEPDNMTSWVYYPWKSANILVQQSRTTPSITKYFGQILDRCTSSM
jgi:ADP-ribose pyrophosphatase YjhB (NUDIX family)